LNALPHPGHSERSEEPTHFAFAAPRSPINLKDPAPKPHKDICQAQKQRNFNKTKEIGTAKQLHSIL
jgi:hypothetical protein